MTAIHSPLTLVKIERFNECVEQLNTIADFELVSNLIFTDGADVCERYCNLVQDVDSQGLLGEDFLNTAINLYHTDAGFRQLMGSISMNFEFWIKAELGVTAHALSAKVLRMMKYEGTPGSAAATNPQLIAHRDDIDTRHAGDGLAAHVNFWLICLFILRMTLHKSTYVTNRIKTHMANVAAQPVKSKAKPAETVTAIV